MMQNLWYQAGRSIINFYVRQIMRADIHHDAPLPKGAKIIAVNHPSTNDPAFITALSREHMTILIKDTVFKVPLFGRSLRMSGHVPVVAGNGRAALEEGIRLLRAGKTVMIFPEGVISPECGFHKAHTGVARLALATGAPVVPVGISINGCKVRQIVSKIGGDMEPSAWYLKGPYAMTVGEPISYTGSPEDYDMVRSVTNQVMHSIITLSRKGDMRLTHREAAKQARRLPTASPKTTLQLAWKGTWLGFQQSARLIANTAAFRLAESGIVFLMMFARSIVG